MVLWGILHKFSKMKSLPEWLMGVFYKKKKYMVIISVLLEKKTLLLNTTNI